MVVTLGYIGWDAFYQTSRFWQARQKWIKYCWVFFWTINILALLVVSPAYSKRNRVESMCYLAKKGDVNALILEDSNSGSFIMPPLF
jgi:hypothetical protein